MYGSNGGGSAAAVYPPGYEIGYDEVTTSVSVAMTTESTSTTVVTCATHTFDGAAVMVEFFSPSVSPAQANTAFITFSLFEGATQIGRIGTVENAAVGALAVPVTLKRRFSPTAGTHTYSIKAYEAGGAGSVGAGAGGAGVSFPMYARFVKV